MLGTQNSRPLGHGCNKVTLLRSSNSGKVMSVMKNTTYTIELTVLCCYFVKFKLVQCAPKDYDCVVNWRKIDSRMPRNAGNT
jgi:hypothetical protein